MGQIIVGNHHLTFEQIKKGNWPSVSTYYEASLTFCKDWLNGQQKFQLHTSGSTGTPKIITVTREQMRLSAEATGRFFHIHPDAKLYCCLNTAMIAGKMMLVRSLVWDGSLYLEEPSGIPLSHFPKETDFDFVAMVPAQVENSINDHHSKSLLQNIKNLIIGGAPLSEKLQKEIAQLPCNIYQTYGMTETVSHIALAKITGKSPLVYQTLSGVKISITPEGQLTIEGPMAKEPVTTNDNVEIIGENRFIWKGRADFTINSGGVKIQPEIIENKIASVLGEQLPGTRYFIAGRPSERWGEEVVLILEASPSYPERKLLDMIIPLVGKYEKPKKIYFLENFLETPSGKIKRRDNLEKALENPQ